MVRRECSAMATGPAHCRVAGEDQGHGEGGIDGDRQGDEVETAAGIGAELDSRGGHSLFAGAPDSVSFKKLRKRLARQARQAIEDYAMLAPPHGGARAGPGLPGGGGRRPRWLVCLSGGKDSYTLLAVLLDLKAHGLLDVDLLACNLDQGQPHFPAHILPEFLTRHGIAHRIERRDTYAIVTAKVPEGQTYCALCSRLRRANRSGSTISDGAVGGISA